MAHSVKEWPTTRGTVIEASFNERIRGAPDETPYTELIPVVAYEYMVDDTTYTSNRLAYNNLTSINQRELEEFRKPYSPETFVDVFYSPRDPSCSVLIPGMPGIDEYLREVFGFIGLVFFYVVMFGGLWVVGQIDPDWCSSCWSN